MEDQLAVTLLKDCPFCGEEILQDAIKCKHCKEFLDGRNSQAYTPKHTDIKAAPVQGVAVGFLAGWSTPFILIPVGILLCLTGIGALIGIPLVLAGIMSPFLGPFMGLGFMKGECPWCGTVNRFLPSQGVTCPACKKRIVIRGKKLLKIE